MNKSLKVIDAEIVDTDAVRIGELYQRVKEAFLDTVLNYLAVGEALSKIPKRNLKSWVQNNEQILGFSYQKASRMVAGYNRFGEFLRQRNYLTDEDARDVSRFMWGHADSELIQQSLSNEHYTPAKYIEAARAVLGTIDLDPASCEEANQIVKATRYFDVGTDGLRHDWNGTVWLNPPYGDLPGPFITKLMEELGRGVSAAIVLVNAHCTDTFWFRPLFDGQLCFTDHRINFYGNEERSGSTHGSVFVYFGDQNQLFFDRFKEFGPVVERVAL